MIFSTHIGILVSVSVHKKFLVHTPFRVYSTERAFLLLDSKMLYLILAYYGNFGGALHRTLEVIRKSVSTNTIRKLQIVFSSSKFDEMDSCDSKSWFIGF